jgi:hypothetical protein
MGIIINFFERLFMSRQDEFKLRDLKIDAKIQAASVCQIEKDQQAVFEQTENLGEYHFELNPAYKDLNDSLEHAALLKKSLEIPIAGYANTTFMGSDCYANLMFSEAKGGFYDNNGFRLIIVQDEEKLNDTRN